MTDKARESMLCKEHLDWAREMDRDGVLVEPGDCDECYALSGRDWADREMKEPYEP